MKKVIEIVYQLWHFFLVFWGTSFLINGIYITEWEKTIVPFKIGTALFFLALFYIKKYYYEKPLGLKILILILLFEFALLFVQIVDGIARAGTAIGN